jgi:ATP-dependent Lhr-like helicase
MRFLLRWQHLTPDTHLAGKQGVRQAIARLQGFEAAASTWERELLAARVSDYRPSWLDELCLAGEVTWARLTPRKAASGAGATATRLTPVSVCLRPDFGTLLSAVRAPAVAVPGPKVGAAAEIHELLRQRGALFFDEIVNSTRRLRSDVERGLRELIAWGLVASDGFQGLRQLVGRGAHTGRRRGEPSAYSSAGFFSGSGPAGRWALVHAPVTDPDQADELAESTARVLLQRYGVLFRDLYPRESVVLPWRDILRALRRLEARGLVRGGRFVSGFNGEQYALPEAVDSLRWVRRQERHGERVWVSAVDPANLVGVVVPGEKQPSQPGRGVLLVDGLPTNETPSPVELPAGGLGAAAPRAVKTPVASKLSPQLGATRGR